MRPTTVPPAPLGLVLVVHAAATWAMTGLIWFVQVVHYPLLGLAGGAAAGVAGAAATATSVAGASAFAALHAAHARQTTLVVGPLMLVELACGLWIALARPTAPAWLGVALLAVVWGATFFIAVPRHNLLATGFDAAVIDSLVRTNWIRTVAWTARALLAAWWNVPLTART